MTTTPIEIGENMMADMVARGLSFRTDGDAFSDAKFNRYAQTFASFPPDIAWAVCRKLRPDGWLPATDALEAEMTALVKSRQDALSALIEGEVLTPYQIQVGIERTLGLALIEAMRPFPMYDNGKEGAREKWEARKKTLSDALDRFEKSVPENHTFLRETGLARKFLTSAFAKRPYKSRSALNRAAGRPEYRDGQAKKKKDALRALDQEAEQDLINEYSGKWPFNLGENSDAE